MGENNTVTCPKCGGELAFSKEDSVWKCAGCCQEFSDADILYYNQYEESNSGTDSYAVFLCPECSKKLIATYDAENTPCPFCGAQLLQTDQKPDGWEPKMIFPQKVSKEDAISILKKKLGKQKFATQYFDAQDAQKINMVYMPVRFVSGQAAIKQNGVKGNEIIEIDNMPVASAGIMSDRIMNMIEPINPDTAVRFGHKLINYSLVAYHNEWSDSLPSNETKIRIKEGTECKLVRDISNLQYTNVILLPIWIYNTVANNERLQFAVNASNGQMAFYQAPESKYKNRWTAIAIISFIAAAELLMLLYYLFDNNVL